MKEKMVDSKRVYEGRLINVRHDRVILEDGTETGREIVEHRGSVAMLPVKDHSIILVKQFRYAFDDYLLEIPAGTLEKGETPEECAVRELAEEIKMKAGKVESMGMLYTSPGFITENMHLFLCTELTPAFLSTDFDENIEIVRMNIDELEASIKKGEIRDGKTVTAFLLWRSYYM